MICRPKSLILGCSSDRYWEKQTFHPGRSGSYYVAENLGGVGKALNLRRVLDARGAGLLRFEYYSSLNGEALYSALGFRRLAQFGVELWDGVRVPSVHMVADI